MNGAELLAKTAAASGIGVCFLNPGTTELAMLRALDDVPEVRAVLGLFEGVCSGAADGYGRMTGKPAMTLFHQGPGLANAVANFHNAQRARTPVFNVIGEQFTWHRAIDESLYLDIEGLAATVSGWFRIVDSADTVSCDVARGILEARKGRIATLVMPHDYQLSQAEDGIETSRSFSPDRIDQETVDRAAAILGGSTPVAFMLGGKALGRQALSIVARIKAVTGCHVYTETFPARWERGAGVVVAGRAPHRADEQNLLRRHRAVVLVGMTEPVTFVGQVGFESRILAKAQEAVYLASPEMDIIDALERLADALKAPSSDRLPAGTVAELERPGLPEGRLTVEKACQVLAATQPDGVIIVEEGITSAPIYYTCSQRTAPHTLLTTVGGNIGWGMPCAIGAAIACPDRPVISFQGDGSAMFTVQSLWTQARESLNITTLIFSNRVYRALCLAREKVGWSGRVSEAVTELKQPPIGWVKLAQAFGVPGVSVSSAEELAHELRICFSEPGPHLIEMAFD
jgi:acetolactate synthase I/II/III large subunit